MKQQYLFSDFLYTEFVIRLRRINKTPLDFYWSFSLHTPSQGLFFNLWIIIIICCISFNNVNQRVSSFVIDAKYLYNFSRLLNHTRLIYIFNYTHTKKFNTAQKSHLLPSMVKEFFICREAMEFILRGYSLDPRLDYPWKQVHHFSQMILKNY